MKNTFLKYSFLVLAIFAFVSCDKDFEEVNTNPNDPTTVPSNLLLGQIQFTAMNTLYSPQLSMDMGSCWAQQISKVQYNDEERYIPRNGSINAVWSRFYVNVIADAQSMHDLAITEGNEAIQGVAKVMQAYSYLLLTDLFGYVPFTEALQAEEGNTTPAYNTQQEVYEGALGLLDSGITLLGGSGTIESGTDFIYGGDNSKWIKFANSLKFRALMRQSDKVNPGTQLDDLVSGGMLFASNDDEAKLIFQDNDSNANPIYETIDLGNRTEYRVCEVLVNKLSGDPRLTTMVAPNADDAYVGKPAGVADVPSATYNINTISGIGEAFLQRQTPGYFMSFSELNFLMAEAVTKGYLTIGDAQTYFQNGIVSSFDAMGASGGGAFAAGLVLTPANALEMIATQNWLGLYLQGFEAAIEQRRTGFPVLTPAVDGAFSAIPSRLTYPTIEASINPENYAAAVAAQGADLLTTPLWYMP